MVRPYDVSVPPEIATVGIEAAVIHGIAVITAADHVLRPSVRRAAVLADVIHAMVVPPQPSGVIAKMPLKGFSVVPIACEGPVIQVAFALVFVFSAAP